MKVLLDSCVSGWVRPALEAAGHDVQSIPDQGEDPGDEVVLRRAYESGRILVTLDKDFGERVIVRHEPHAGLIRLEGLSSQGQTAVCATVLDRYGEELAAGAIVTATERRVRIRPA